MQPSVPVEPRAGFGFGCTEAPRGICWHRYEFEADGTIRTARIVPPTSQNQPSIEADLMAVAAPLVSSNPMMSFATAASTAFAITIPVSPAPHISSNCLCIEHERGAGP